MRPEVRENEISLWVRKEKSGQIIRGSRKVALAVQFKQFEFKDFAQMVLKMAALRMKT